MGVFISWHYEDFLTPQHSNNQTLFNRNRTAWIA